MVRLAFWKKDKGNLLSHKDGLSAEEVAELQTLKVGDRLIIWDNQDKRSDKSPDYTLKVFTPKQQFDTPPMAPTSGGFKPVK